MLSRLFSNLIDDLDEKKKKVKIPTVKFSQFLSANHMGFTPKEFVMCKGWFLRSMFEELRNNPNNNYVTCMDSLVYDNDFGLEDLDRTKVSCIIKRWFPNEDYDLSTEVVVSRLANLYGLKTQYVVPVEDVKKCICIDFLSGKQIMEDYAEFTGKNKFSVFEFDYGDCAIRKWIEDLIDELGFRLAKLPSSKATKIKDDVVRDFIKQYLFKKYIVRDIDAVAVNYSFVYDEDDISTLQVSPAYDFSASFISKSMYPDLYGMREDLQYLILKFPNTITDIMKDFLSVDMNKVKSIINEFSPHAYQKVVRFDYVNSAQMEMKRQYNLLSNIYINSKDI